MTINEVRRQICSETGLEGGVPRDAIGALALNAEPLPAHSELRETPVPRPHPGLREKQLPGATPCQEGTSTLESRGLIFIFNSFIEL